MTWMDPSHAPASESPPTEAKRPARRSWLRRLLPFIAILLLLLFCAPLALGLAPVRDYVADKVGEAIGRKVDIGSASAFWFSGVSLEDVTVHSPEGFPEPLARVKKLHADIDLLKLMGGAVEAEVRVEEPHIVLEGRDGGATNFDNLFPNTEDEPEKEREPPHVVVKVLGGRVDSRGGGDLPASTLADIRGQVQMLPDGQQRAELRGTLGAAGPARQDVALHGFVNLDAERNGPVALTTDGLIDLAPIAPSLSRTLKLQSLEGAAQVYANGELHAGSRFSGKLKVLLDGIKATTSQGSSIATKKVRAAANLTDEPAQDATQGRVYLIADQVHVLQVPSHASNDGSTREFMEDRVEITIEGRLQPSTNGHDIGLNRAMARAGEALKLRSTTPIDIRLVQGKRPVVAGEVAVEADLGRLSNLQGLIPALADLESGHVVARIDAIDLVADDGVHGTNFRVGARVANLKMMPSSSLPRGLQEPDASVRLQSFFGDDGTLRVQVHEANSSVITSRTASRALEILVPNPDLTNNNAGPSIAGPFDISVDLSRVSEILGTHMGLGERELIAGTLTLRGMGRGNAEHGEIEAEIETTGLAWPKRWELAEGPSEVRGKFMAARNGTALRASLDSISALGCLISGAVDLHEDGNGAWHVGTGTADIRGELQQVRALQAALDPTGSSTLGGQFRYRAEVQAGDGGFTIARGALRIAGFDLRSANNNVAISEPTVGLDHVISIPPTGQRGRIDLFNLESQTLSAKLSNGSFAIDPVTDLQGRLEVSGQAARLAPYLRTMLGEDYKDLEGDGAIQGTIDLTSGPGPHLGNLGIDANLQLGAWSTGGIALSNTTVTAKRAGPGDPLHTTLQAGVNGGGLGMSAAMRLGQPDMPWVARAQMRGVDTSDWIVSDGAARGMSYALPVLLPADGAGGVLSGRLDADITARASDFKSPVLMDSLTGKGTIEMKDGEIKGSTLFGGSGAQQGQGLGKLVSVLSVAAPVVGKVLGEAAKALAFQRIDSRFTIAQRIINVEKIEVAGQVLSVFMKGRVGLNKSVHMNADIQLGDAGEIVKRVIPGAKIPLQIRGSLDQPAIIPRLDTGSILRSGLLDGVRKKLPGVGKKLPKNPLDALRGAMGR